MTKLTTRLQQVEKHVGAEWDPRPALDLVWAWMDYCGGVTTEPPPTPADDDTDFWGNGDPLGKIYREMVQAFKDEVAGLRARGEWPPSHT